MSGAATAALVQDLFGRVHRAIEVRKTWGLDEAKLACTERQPKSDYSKLYPWHQVVRAREDSERCVACYPPAPGTVPEARKQD